MTQADELNVAQEAPWIATLRGLGERAWNNSPFTMPLRAAMSFANSPKAQQFVNDAADYVKGTDLNSVSESIARLNPISAVPYLANDAMQGKLLDTLRQQAGQVSQVPTDIVAGTLAVPELASMASTALGGPEIPHETASKWSTDVRDFGKSYGEVLAGRPLATDVLRGSPADMAAGHMRNIGGAILPVPSKVTAPITTTLSKLTNNVQAIDTLTAAFGRTLEVMTPLAFNPTPKTVATAGVIAGVAGPATEAGAAAYVKGEQEKTNEAAKIAETEAVQGAQDAGVIKPVVAGMPGVDTPEFKVGAALAGVALFARYRREIGSAISNAIDKVPPLSKKLGGFDPANPLDENFQSLRVRMAQQRSDASASLSESTRRALGEVNVPKSAADDLADMRKEDISRRSGAALSHRIGTWRNTGEALDSTAVTRMPWDERLARRNMLTPDELTLHNQAAHAEQELHTRSRIFNLNAQAGQSNAHIRNYGYNLYDTPSADLAAIVRNARANPKIADMLDSWNDTYRSLTKYGVERGRFEPNEAGKFLNNNPHYVPPTNASGPLLNDRDIVKNYNKGAGAAIPRGAKTFEELGDPIKAQERYIDEMFRSTEAMGSKRAFIQDMKSLVQMGSQHAKDILGRTGPLGRDAEHRVVTWRDAYGKKQSMEINDAVVREAFKSLGNPSSLQMINGALQQSTKFFQSGAVGPMSLLRPTFFPVDSVAYQAMSGVSFSKPSGVALSLTDKLAQKLGSKSASGIPGDPSFGLMGLGQGALNIGSVIVDRSAQALHNSVTKNGMLSKFLSPAMLNTAADAMSAFYKKTGLYEMQQAGLMGPGFASNKALQGNMSGQSITGAVSNAVSSTVKSVTGVEPHMPGILKDAGGKLKSGYSFVDDIMHAVSSGPSVVVLKMNRNLPTGQEWKAASAARNMSGDPGKSGAFRDAPWEKHLALASPFGNPTYQAFARLAESARRNPARLATGMFMTATMPGAMSSLWNASNGPEYSQWEFLERPPERQASHIYMARPGHPPQEGWELPVEPMFRPFMWAGRALAGGIFGIFTGEIHKNENSDMKAAIDEMIWHGMAPSLDKGTVSRGVVDQSLLLPPHPLIGSTAAVMGGKMDSYLDIGDPKKIIENKQAGFIEGTAADPTKQKLFGMNMPAFTENLMSALGAGGLQAAYNMVTGIEADVTGSKDVPPKSLGDAVGYQVEGWKQRAGDTTIGQLFGTHRATTPSQEQSAHVVKRKMDTINEIVDAFNASQSKGSEKTFGTRNTGKEFPEGVAPRTPQDMQTAQFAYDVKSVQDNMKKFKEEIQLAYKQYGSIKADSRISVDDKRIRMEEQAHRVIDSNRRMLQDVQRFEAILSLKYGKPIAFDGYDKDVPFSQQTWKPRWAQ